MSGNSINYCWPADFPEGVPEELGVAPAEGKVYRLVRSCPPTKEDFLIHRIEYPSRRYSKTEEPKSYGISFWSKLSKIKRVQQNYPSPEQFGERVIVTGNLVHEFGVIPSEPAKDGHITLWAQEGTELHLHITEREGE
ncbi:hypothetical protein [Vibrio parahaemolyticus]|uniref:hypothetical protein n=1 Tax=Vibrio parahaemolyticus TaxID=670 RepID=UPI00084B3296|nr:hypothetical protein [Vibrio parahaemolyticus]ODX29214.1 hypothetical protein BBM01_18925 [Vibrio parahaemolyticus]